MTKEKSNWEPCFVDPYRGIAFFDDIIIETDKINDPRYDRVLPILEEEQVLMCRQMKQRLNNLPLLALDVGTGSGVFAIYAAMYCNCKVLALDINPRALNFARCNANKIIHSLSHLLFLIKVIPDDDDLYGKFRDVLDGSVQGKNFVDIRTEITEQIPGIYKEWQEKSSNSNFSVLRTLCLIL